MKSNSRKKWVCLMSVLMLSGCGSGSDSDDELPAPIPTPIPTPTPVTTPTLIQKTVGFFQEVQSDQQLLDHVTASLAESNGGVNEGIVLTDPVAILPAAPESFAADSDSSSADFSSTYVQEKGVDEADVVKYDGNNIYIAEQPDHYYGWGCEVCVIFATPLFERSFTSPVPPIEPPVDSYAKIRVMATQDEPASATQLAEITISEPNLAVEGLYILPAVKEDQHDVLAVVGRGQYNYGWYQWDDNEAWADGRAAVLLLDVSDPESATETWKLELEGHIVTTRRVDETLYVVSRYYPDINYSDDTEYTIEDILPSKILNDGDVTPLVAGTDCLIPNTSKDDGDYNYSTFITITAINLRDPDSYESICVDANVEGYYASTEALYLTNTDWYGDETQTTIHKFNYADGAPSYAGTGVVPGRLGWDNPSFRMGERNGVLHVVTSPDQRCCGFIGFLPAIINSSDDVIGTTKEIEEVERLEGHRLTLLEESATAFELVEVSHIPNDVDTTPIGKPGEDVYAVRYMGDRAYVVTFMRTDPLYVIDIADKSVPKVRGALEVTGFSSLLHPISDSLLLGFGTETTDTGSRLGFKLELFNVENPDAPYSLDSIVIGGQGTSSAVTRDHKALALLPGNADRNTRFALPLTRYEGYNAWVDAGLYLFEIEGANSPSSASLMGKTSLVIESMSEIKTYPQYQGVERSIITSEAVHYIGGDKVWSAPWNSPNDLVGPQ